MKIRMLYNFILVVILLSFSVLSTTNNIWIDPSSVSVNSGSSSTVVVKANSDAPVSSVEIIGTFDSTKITPTFTPTVVGADGVAWASSFVRVTYPNSNTFKLQASTLGGSTNFIPVGTQSVLTIAFNALVQDSTNIQITSAKVNTVTITNLAGSTITITAGAPACTEADWSEPYTLSACSVSCGSGTQTKTGTQKVASASCTGEVGKVTSQACQGPVTCTPPQTCTYGQCTAPAGSLGNTIDTSTDLQKLDLSQGSRWSIEKISWLAGIIRAWFRN